MIVGGQSSGCEWESRKVRGPGRARAGQGGGALAARLGDGDAGALRPQMRTLGVQRCGDRSFLGEAALIQLSQGFPGHSPPAKALSRQCQAGGYVSHSLSPFAGQ